MDKEEKFYSEAAIELLTNRFGIAKPSAKQIEEMKSILFNAWLKRKIRLDERLTNREKLCLFLASQGKTYREIAEVLGIRPSTVKGYEKEILRKLNCQNMKQAIGIGIRYGEITHQYS
jgi:DNA-binding CsgD family transcriptional regulator